jgi:hypothetical protein
MWFVYVYVYVYVLVCDYMSTAEERKFHYDQNQYSLDPLKLEQEYKPYSTNFKIGITIFTMQYKKGLSIFMNTKLYSQQISHEKNKKTKK